MEDGGFWFTVFKVVMVMIVIASGTRACDEGTELGSHGHIAPPVDYGNR